MAACAESAEGGDSTACETLEIEATLEFARAAEREGRRDQAVKAYRAALANDPGLGDAWFHLALLHHGVGDFRSALDALDRCLALQPDFEWAHFRVGLLALSLDRRLAAVDAFRRALASAPHFEEIRINLGAAFNLLEWWDESVRLLRPMAGPLTGWWASTRDTALKRHRAIRIETLAALKRRRRPGARLDREATLSLARQLLSLGRLRAAEALGSALMEAEPGYPAVELQASLILRREGLSSALAFLRTKAAACGGLAAYQFGLSRLLYEAGAFEEALAAYQRGEDLAPSHADRRRKALLLLVADRRDELLRFCRDWMARTGDTTPYTFAMAVHRDRAAIGRLIESSPAPVPVWAKVVQFWDSATPPADVAEVMQTWRRLNPKLPHLVFDAMRARAFILGRHGFRAMEAFDACHHPAMKANFFRIAYLAAEGGLYVDADDACVRPVEPIVSAMGETRFIASLSGDVTPYVHNWFLAAQPRSSILESALEDMIGAIERACAEDRRCDIWQTTGAGLITRAVARNLSSSSPESVILLDMQLYQTFAETRDLAYKATVAGNWRL